jgi:outer membrane immunogenic protein
MRQPAFFLAALLALVDTAALAADLPSKKAATLLPPPPLWTGFYAGLNAGYGFAANSSSTSVVWGVPGPSDYWSTNRETEAPATALGSGGALSGYAPIKQSGFIGGGQIGYNYQYGSSFVIGLETDIQGGGLRGSGRHIGAGAEIQSASNLTNGNYIEASSNAWGGATINAGVDWLGTVRGRVGYLVSPTLLIFGTGGLTYGGVYGNVTNYAYVTTTSSDEDGPAGYGANHTFFGGGSRSQTRVGWNAGGGIEWLFAPNWSVKAEAIYWSLGNATIPTVAYAVAPRPDSDPPWYGNSAFTAIGGTRVNYQGVIARMGLNYHFNWGAPAPIIAQY